MKIFLNNTMLLEENILEVAYNSDYFTTVKLLEIYPDLDTDKFWDEKFKRMYPTSPSLLFFSHQEVFLINERSNSKFVLLFKSNGCPECGDFGLYKNILYEDNGSLYDKFSLYNNIDDLIYINVNVMEQYIVIGGKTDNLSVLDQFDCFSQAEDYIENDIEKNPDIKNLLSYNHKVYFIIDMNHFIVSFENVKLERAPNQNRTSYKYWSYRFNRINLYTTNIDY